MSERKKKCKLKRSDIAQGGRKKVSLIENNNPFRPASIPSTRSTCAGFQRQMPRRWRRQETYHSINYHYSITAAVTINLQRVDDSLVYSRGECLQVTWPDSHSVDLIGRGDVRGTSLEILKIDSENAGKNYEFKTTALFQGLFLDFLELVNIFRQISSILLVFTSIIEFDNYGEYIFRWITVQQFPIESLDKIPNGNIANHWLLHASVETKNRKCKSEWQHLNWKK